MPNNVQHTCPQKLWKVKDLHCLTIPVEDTHIDLYV